MTSQSHSGLVMLAPVASIHVLNTAFD